eukprot:2479775-Pyramimonas_sp.AAC.1
MSADSRGTRCGAPMAVRSRSFDCMLGSSLRGASRLQRLASLAGPTLRPSASPSRCETPG